MRIAPVTSNTSNETVYESQTFQLNAGANQSSTSVTIPQELLTKIAQNSGTETPVIYATLLGRDLQLNRDQNTSQVSINCSGA